MAAMTNVLKNKLLDAIFRGVSYTFPTSIYIGLFTTAPTAAGGGTEVSGGAYARVLLSPSTTNWAATNSAGSTTSPSSGTSGQTSNNSVITFPTSTASWGTAVWLGIFDASTGGNLLLAGALTAPQSIPSGIAPTIAIGTLTYQIDGSF